MILFKEFCQYSLWHGHNWTNSLVLIKSFQFDEEFTARQEAQAELQKREEKIKELESEVKQLQTQVIKLYHIEFHS